MSGITHILGRLEQGEAQAAEELLPLVYEELRKLAAAKMAQEKPGQTLQATALVHEAWLRLAGDAAPQFQNCAHFLGAAAEAMRRILIERARRRRSCPCFGSGAFYFPGVWRLTPPGQFAPCSIQARSRAVSSLVSAGNFPRFSTGGISRSST